MVIKIDLHDGAHDGARRDSSLLSPKRQRRRMPNARFATQTLCSGEMAAEATRPTPLYFDRIRIGQDEGLSMISIRGRSLSIGRAMAVPHRELAQISR